MNCEVLDIPLVEATDLSRTFRRGAGEVSAVSGATFRILGRETIAVVGRSGSGKSSLLHIIEGLDDPSGGTIVWPALGERDQLRPGRIGAMFQSPSLVPSLDVGENVMLPLALMGVPGDTTEQAMVALARFGIADLAQKLPEELSGGQMQRVALVRALITRPRLVVCDEPTGQLDRASAAIVMEALLNWTAASGASLIVATHDLEVARLMKRRWRMDHGALTTEVEGVPS